MQLTPDLHRHYTSDHDISARQAQRMAHLISFGPVVFQTARIMLKRGILKALRDSDDGLTPDRIASVANLSPYAISCLLEASLSIGIVTVQPDTDRYYLSKTGYFLLTDPAINVDIDFNHDVNYKGWFHLDEALAEGRPAGLHTISDAPTVYQGLSRLDPDIRQSWFGFDHFYSDNSFDQALDIVFARKPRRLLDVGGNTGKWALRCVEHDPDVRVTILDLPGQVEMMMHNISGRPGADRINGLGIDLLDPQSRFPEGETFDAVWMSQFLDCFSDQQIVNILLKARTVMKPGSRLYIMEPVWNRQRYESAALCLTLTSLYFTAIANGNSKMFSTEQLTACIAKAGLKIEAITDGIGWGHSLVECSIQ